LSYNRKTPFAGKFPKPRAANPPASNSPRIAYVLLVHEGFNQTVRLLNAIYDPDNYYMLHVDFKAPKLKEALIKYTDSFPNMYPTSQLIQPPFTLTVLINTLTFNRYVLKQSFDIGWGGPEMVYSTLEGIFGLLDVSEKWDFVINLSSKDYPLCSNDELASYLGTRQGKNFDVADVPPRDSEKYWYSFLAPFLYIHLLVIYVLFYLSIYLYILRVGEQGQCTFTAIRSSATRDRNEECPKA
jgi:hypothetical protein